MKRVCALGFFDGVHLGHAEIIRKAIGIAKERGISPAVVTFDNKPKNMAGATRLLNDAETKKDMIRTLFGDIEIIELKFTDKLKNTSAADFTARCLIEKLGAVCAVVGENFRFGKGAEGTPETLEKALDTAVVKTVAVAGETVSSTAIRALISEGNIEKANLFLGHPHVVSGRVSHGDARGRKLGIATLNLRMPEGIVRPKAGVYVTRTLIEGVRYGSITNFGARPTFYQDGQYLSETHVFNCREDLYGKEVKLLLYAFLRPEKRFASPDELREAVCSDIETAKSYLEKIKER